MKRQLFLFCFLFFIIRVFGQSWVGINFDDSINLFRISIDTTIPYNIWQIGQPQKNIFYTAHTLPNSIITDTLNPYPIDNNSVFYLGTEGDLFLDSHYEDLSFWYRIDTDSLNDYGRIEISLDAGQTWNNILKDMNGGGDWYVEDSIGWIVISGGSGDTLVFTGSTNGWYRFSSTFYLQEQQYYDTIIYRFSFHSDSTVESKDGWIIDDIGYVNVWERVKDNMVLSSIYPNPANNIITISSRTMIKNLEILNSLGITLMKPSLQSSNLLVDITELNPGIYYCLIIYLDGTRNIEKFIKYP